MTQQSSNKVICQAVRPTTGSKITIELPEHVGTDPHRCVQWIGEQFDWQFIPTTIKVIHIKGEENNDDK